jgi:hypothetical protein
MTEDEACAALAAKRRVKLTCDGSPRVVEIHAVGLTTKQQPAMRVWQLPGGRSSWRIVLLERVEQFEMLPDSSDAPRPGYKPGARRFSRVACEL